MSNKPTNDNLTTRIITGLSAQHQIVSLPYWAWYWLEDFMHQHKVSYAGIIETFGGHDDIKQTLRNIAELHQEFSMREVYNLSNDNEATDDIISMRVRQKKSVRKASLKLPKIFKLFGFMPCATTLEAVWERRHYDDNNKVN